MNTDTQNQIIARLRDEYADTKSGLHYTNPYELLVATILSAQCTDERVNLVTVDLFKRFPDAQSLAQATPEEIEGYIKSCGLFRTKALRLSQTAQILVRDFGGQVPSTMEELTTLPGVGRKTASVVLAFGFHIPAVPVDTHVNRVANRIGFAHSSDPVAVEEQLKERFAREDWIDSHHWLIWHGRRICKAQRPKCAQCVLEDLCPAAHEFDKSNDSRQSKNPHKVG